MAPEQKKEEEEELVPVGDGLEEKEEEELQEELEDEQEELDDEEKEEEEEERLGAGEDDEDDEEKKAKRKVERKTRRQRQKDARARDKQELVFQKSYIEKLGNRVNELEGRMGHGETAQIDTRITDVKSKIKLADQVISKAITQSDGAAATEAQSIRDGLRDNLNQLESAKDWISQQRAAPQAETDPNLMRHAQNWMRAHAWWDPNGGDADSLEVSRIDAQLVNEGMNPTTEEYWNELTERVAEALPTRSGNGQARTPNKKVKRKPSGPTMSVSGRERPLKKNEVYISPDRKAAMVEAGVWDDPEQRQKYLKSYADYDAEHRT